MVCKKVLLTSMLLGLLLVGCNKPDLSNFITEEAFQVEEKRCKGAYDEYCSLRPFLAKVEAYCLDKKLSESQCKDIKDDVVLEGIKFRRAETEFYRKTTETIKSLPNK
jgi:hypothetical protein